ncbi:A/G-specific adenine glycosylase [Candidatus Poribacteria bacterium]|nr:A/G-specific adenine glycosylase [Candidatus Poribacteria bacterium]
MISKDIAQFRENLLQWFDKTHRKLPWRETKAPYRIWVSEVMLQQTQVKKVLEYYQKFVDRFPNVQSLADAELQEVLKCWEGLGYYARARNLHQAAKVVVQDLGGEIPADYATFRQLPGVGEYIAAAVQSIAFNHPYAVVDGNVKRVLARLFLIDTPINQAASARVFRGKADLLLDGDAPGNFNQAMMELGATICRPQSPLCMVCPVNLFCSAFQTARQEEFPLRTPSKPVPEYHIAVGVVYKGDHVLITQRKADGLLGGLWEFPGGKVSAGETAEDACIREIHEEVNLSVEIMEYFTRVRHAYTHFKIVMDVFRCRYQSGEVVLNEAVDYRWITLDALHQYPFPRANHKFIPLLKEISEAKESHVTGGTYVN